MHGEDLQQLESLQNSFKGYFCLDDSNVKRIQTSFLADRGCIVDTSLSKITSFDLRIKDLVEPEFNLKSIRESPGVNRRLLCSDKVFN